MFRSAPQQYRISIRSHVKHPNVQGSARQIFPAELWREPEVRRLIMPIAHRMSCVWNIAWRLAEEGKAPLVIGYRGLTARARFIPIALLPGPLSELPKPELAGPTRLGDSRHIHSTGGSNATDLG